MKCPHCLTEIHEGFATYPLHPHGYPVGEENGSDVYWQTQSMKCPAPACKKAIIKLLKSAGRDETTEYVYPRASTRPIAPADVPAELANDYNEAALILTYSAKSSAALSRRCLQSLLRLRGFNQKNLAPAIDALLATKVLPSWLAENVDSIRNVGNFAAHPMKDTNSGAVLEVEPHEAEWNLDVLEGLFDFYYVQPARDAAKRAAFNAKLAAAGKDPMK